MPNPNVGILEEIDDQNLSGVTVGSDTNPNSITITSLDVTCLISWGLGNDGWACTVSAECQTSGIGCG